MAKKLLSDLHVIDDADDFDPPEIIDLPSAPDIPEIAADPELMAAEAKVRRLARAGQYLDLLIDAEGLRAHLRRHGEKGNRNEDLRLRLQKREVQLAEFGDITPDHFPALADEAIALFDDREGLFFDDLLPFRLEDHDRLTGLKHLREILRAAGGVLFRQHDEIVRAKSREMAEKLRPQHNALMIKVYRALQELARTADFEADFRTAFARAGYTFPSDFMMPPMIANLLALVGSERVLASPGLLVDWRRQLEAQGLLG